MKNGVKVAVAVAAGYYLGRHRKLRLAAALAAAGLGLRAGKGGLAQGVKLLESPELEELTGRLGDELREAGRTAAKAATTKRLNALSDLIHARAEGLRVPQVGQVGQAAGQVSETAEQTVAGDAAGGKPAEERPSETEDGQARKSEAQGTG